MIETIRRIIDEKGHLPIAAQSLTTNINLYEAGLTPFAAIQVALALEKEFKIEFPTWMLNRESIASIRAILTRIHELQPPNSQPEAA